MCSQHGRHDTDMPGDEDSPPTPRWHDARTEWEDSEGEIGGSGTFDGGIDPVDKIGELFDFEVIDFFIFGSNVMDAAIASTTISELGQATLPEGYGMPNSTIFGDMDGNGFFDNKNGYINST